MTSTLSPEVQQDFSLVSLLSYFWLNILNVILRECISSDGLDVPFSATKNGGMR